MQITSTTLRFTARTVAVFAALVMLATGAAEAQYSGDKIKPGWCAPGTQRLTDVEITGAGKWKSADFTDKDCTNLNYLIDNIQHGGNQLTWAVPFTNANIQCSCQTAQAGGSSGGESSGSGSASGGGSGGNKITAGMCQQGTHELTWLRKKLNVNEPSSFKAGDFTDKDCADQRYSVSKITKAGSYLTWETPFIKWQVGCRCKRP